MSDTFRGRIGVLGSGALGAFYGAKLARSGHDVNFLMRADYDAVRANGLEVRSCDGDFHLAAPSIHRTAAELGRCDLVLVGLKATQNDALAELLAPTVGPETLVLTLQNGLGNEERIAAELRALGHRDPERRILGGVAFLCSNRIAPGVVHHSAYGWMRLAEMSGAAQPRTRAIAASFERSGVACEVFDSIPQIRWAKLVWNIPFNGLGVGAEFADTKVILESEPLCSAARGLMEEVAAAARADGAEIGPEFLELMMKVTVDMGPYRTSMQIDLEEGRALEVEAILGEPLRRARRAGVPTPRLEMLYGIVRRREELRRRRHEGA